MMAVADNLNTRNKTYLDAVAKRDKKTIAGLAIKLKESGADIINLQCSLDGTGDDAAMVDILDPDIRKALNVIKAFRDEIVFSQADIS